MTTYHVTRVSDQGVYGHAEHHCDESGCAGDEHYLGSSDDLPDAVRGETVEIDGVTEYVDVRSDADWGSPVTEDEHEALCAAMEARCTETEGPALAIQVRAARRREIAGLYESGVLVRTTPETVSEILGETWQYAIETCGRMAS